ncbi:MAG: penicillin-binding protein 1C [Syntrophorhabdaceae bacterium]|nr:penicillin-binding protein 1C [Syntrophorhabdaceae bacterium]
MSLKYLKGVPGICVAAVLALTCLAGAGTLFVARSVGDTKIPAFQSFRASYRASDAVLLDRHREVIHALRTDDTVRRLEWTRLADVSPSFLQTAVFVEDRRFFSHKGVDLLAFASAFARNFTSGRLSGASTISMQVASIIDKTLKPKRVRRDLGQKWRQVLAAIALEKNWSKEEILEAYINLIYYRGELQGVRAASKGLFGKEPSGLTQLESFILASLITSPNATRERVALRSWRLAQKTGVQVTRDDVDRKTGEALSSAYSITSETSVAPHVARIVLTPGCARQVTTLDGRLQRFALQSLRNNLASLRSRNVSDGAVMVVDNVTGDILAYVGNSGRTSSAVWMDGVRARRQAGSTLKPFLYGLAVEKGYLTASSILEDAPLSIMTPTGLYVPQNYDNQFRGNVSVRTALASSLNVPAVKTLLVAGLVPFVERLKELGFRSITEEPEFYGFSIALGSADIELYELVGAYRTLALGGRRGDMRLIKGEAASARVRVMDEKAAYIISQILSDRESRAVTFGLENPLSTRFWTAVKTGTSKDMRDNWCVGFSGRYTVGVWVGNFSGEPMHDVSGISGAAPIWLEVMNFLHAGLPSKAPKRPSGVTVAKVRFEKDMEPSREEFFLEGTQPVSTVRAQQIHQNARIVYPPEGTLITIDPDIPDALQRVALRFEPRAGRFRWVLNDTDAGSDLPLLLWEPRRGNYTLSIVDHRGSVVDSVSFVVR